MKRCLLVVTVLLALGIPAWADPLGAVINVTLSPGSQNLAVSTSASLTIGWELTQQPAAGDYTGTVFFEYQILTGPDAGPVVNNCCGAYTFVTSDLDMPHSRSFSFTNDGAAGTDVIEAFLVDSMTGFTDKSSPVSVNWSTPEPASWLLLAIGALGLLLLTRARNHFAPRLGV